jgi:argininosuccinate lyase
LSELQSLHPGITVEVLSVLTVEKSVRSRTSFGGAAPQEVRKQIKYWKKRIVKV